MRKVKTYDKEFIRETVKLAKESNKPKSAIARDLGIGVSTLHGWIAKSVEMRPGEIIIGSEITQLKRELATAIRERDILKKAVAIFSKPSI